MGTVADGAAQVGFIGDLMEQYTIVAVTLVLHCLFDDLFSFFPVSGIRVTGGAYRVTGDIMTVFETGAVIGVSGAVHHHIHIGVANSFESPHRDTILHKSCDPESESQIGGMLQIGGASQPDQGIQLCQILALGGSGKFLKSPGDLFGTLFQRKKDSVQSRIRGSQFERECVGSFCFHRHGLDDPEAGIFNMADKRTVLRDLPCYINSETDLPVTVENLLLGGKGDLQFVGLGIGVVQSSEIILFPFKVRNAVVCDQHTAGLGRQSQSQHIAPRFQIKRLFKCADGSAVHILNCGFHHHLLSFGGVDDDALFVVCKDFYSWFNASGVTQ